MSVEPTLSTAQVRVLKRAAAAWLASKPHQAYDIVHDAGMGEHWQSFQAGMLDHARDRYQRRMGLRA